MLIDYFAIIEGLWTRKIHASLFWWSTIFPVSTVASSLATLGQAANSPAFKVIAVAVFVFLCCIYLVNLYLTIRLVLNGELLGSCLPKHAS
jgi:tellurite resistance protein TehA-like permease